MLKLVARPVLVHQDIIEKYLAQSSTSSCDAGDDEEDDAEAAEDYDDFKKWLDAKDPPKSVSEEPQPKPAAASKPVKTLKCKFCSKDSSTCISS